MILDYQAPAHWKVLNKLNQKYKPQVDVFELLSKHSSYIFNCSIETVTVWKGSRHYFHSISELAGCLFLNIK